MVNPTHLERLGTELKCPVCLSLLNSAVSLTCNHAFCNSCIMKSMKSTASCPVCKVPFHRREVRPAPNMDSLVSIYKSMESASGVNIFVSQNVYDTRVPDGHTQVTSDGEANPKIYNQAETKRSLKGKGHQKYKNNSQSTFVKPSFPTKKRVQVPHSLLAESPFQREKFRSGSTELPQKGPAMLRETPLCDGKGDLFPSPFFWLREEEDVDNSSEQTLGDQSTDTSTRIAPSFRDIMDSDDEKPSETAPSGELNEKPFDDLFDSEMFEWTQKPCSPALSLSPYKLQVVLDTGVIDGNHERFVTAESKYLDSNHARETIECQNYKGESFDAVMETSMSYVGITDSDDQPMRVRSRKRARKGTAKQAEFTKMDPSIQSSYSKKLTVHDENQRCAFNESSEKFLDDNSRNKLGVHINAKEPNSQSVTVFTSKEEATKDGIRNGPEKLITPKKVGRNQRKECNLRMLEGQKDSVESTLAKRKPMSKGARTNLENGFGLSNSCVPLASCKGAKEVGANKKTSRNDKGCSKELRTIKKLEISRSTSEEEDTEPIERIQSNPDVCILNNSSSSINCNSCGEMTLRKCEAHLLNYDCAFCLSSAESEVYGEILHCCNGKPVAANYNGRTKITHTHRNCAEWAPNVYFEGDNTINLEAELSRSRRIKCSLCGLKGAALGCYEKSCRRSFHVPCAKLTPRCRWDEDNFVMLCPVHASAELPCEKIGSKEKRKKYSPKVCIPTNRKCDNLPGEKDGFAKQIWRTQGLGKKIVICCSALTTPERNVVSEFERLSKVSILKKWDSSVTHLIASTNENGACRRTLKTLMGILEGKWILQIDWIKACIKAMKLVDEEPYEISVDIHGIRDGPRLGRLRVFNKQPHIFDGLEFHLMGDFLPSYKSYLQDLVIAAGGMILHRKPVTEDINAPSSDSFAPKTYIIYSLELPDKFDPSDHHEVFSHRKNNAAALANMTGAEVASNLWILNCMAACKLLSVAE